MLSQDAKFHLQNAKFGNLIITKIIKFVATRCQIFKLMLAYSAPPDPLARFRGPTSKVKGKGEKGWVDVRPFVSNLSFESTDL